MQCEAAWHVGAFVCIERREQLPATGAGNVFLLAWGFSWIKSICGPCSECRYVVDHDFLDNLRLLATEGLMDDDDSIGLSREDLPLRIRNKPLLDEEYRNKPRATKVSRLDDSIAFAQVHKRVLYLHADKGGVS